MSNTTLRDQSPATTPHVHGAPPAESGLSDEPTCPRIVEAIEHRVGKRRFDMWFNHSTRFGYDQDQRTLQVATPNQFIAERIGRDFHDQLLEAANETIGQSVRISLTVEPDRFHGGGGLNGSASDWAQSDGRDSDQPSAHTRNTLGNAPSAGGDQDRLNDPGGHSRPTRRKSNGSCLRHRLDQFIVGNANRLAYAAAQRMAEDDATGHPAFIHGGCGLGKTHLLQGACQALLTQQPGANIRYTTGEQFTNEYIQAVRTNKLDAFRRKMRRLDLLAVDDVHFIANKEKTQQEFLHSIDAIDLSGARLLLASDSHPKLIHEFSEGLVSRCVRGLVVEIKPPDEQTRRQLIRGLARRRGLVLREEAVDALTHAHALEGSVREIEGALTKLHALAMLGQNHDPSSAAKAANGAHRVVNGGQTPIGLSLIRQLIGSDSAARPRKPIRLQTILETVCDHLGVAPRQVTGSNRQRQSVIARALTVHLARQLTSMSYPEIASGFGKKNHSTIISAGKRMRKLLDEDQPVRLPGRPEPTTPSQLLEHLHHKILREQ